MLKRFILLAAGCIALFAYVSCSTGGGSGDSADDGDNGGGGESGGYTVTYDSNGATSGTVPVDGKSYSYDAVAIVKGNPDNLVRTGYKFMGWSLDKTTAYDPSKEIYDQPDPLFVRNNITLYAVWTLAYSVTYSAPDATSGSVPSDSLLYESGKSVTVQGNRWNLARTGYDFSGWKDSVQGLEYVAGDSYTITQDVTFSACWSVSSSGGTTTHGYADVVVAESALTSGMLAGLAVTDTSKTAYSKITTSGSSTTVVSTLKGYTKNGLTLTGDIASVESATTTSMNGTVGIVGGTVTKIVYAYTKIGTSSFTGKTIYTFSDGSTWDRDMATDVFTQE